MGNISYTAHVSNKKSAITSKSKLAGVAKHNLRKYKSSDYSKDNIFIVYGTSNLIDDVKTVYHKEFDQALEEYNKKHGITPRTIKKDIRDSIKATLTQDIGVEYKLEKQEDVKETINKLTEEMLEFASKMEFEQAAEIRDKIKELEKLI